MDFDYSTSDFAYAEYLSLPSSAKLSQRDLIRVCKEINDFYAKS
jgi:dTDP-4-amino-4,6-dideoxygalactose transaminase